MLPKIKLIDMEGVAALQHILIICIADRIWFECCSRLLVSPWLRPTCHTDTRQDSAVGSHLDYHKMESNKNRWNNKFSNFTHTRRTKNVCTRLAWLTDWQWPVIMPWDRQIEHQCFWIGNRNKWHEEPSFPFCHIELEALMIIVTQSKHGQMTDSPSMGRWRIDFDIIANYYEHCWDQIDGWTRDCWVID